MTRLERIMSPEKIAVSILGTTIISVLSLGLGLWLTVNHASDQAARKAALESNCAVWEYMANAKPPPATERGVALMQRARAYYDRFNCEEYTR